MSRTVGRYAACELPSVGDVVGGVVVGKTGVVGKVGVVLGMGYWVVSLRICNGVKRSIRWKMVMMMM